MEAREDDGPTLDEVVARTADDVDGVSRGGGEEDGVWHRGFWCGGRRLLPKLDRKPSTLYSVGWVMLDSENLRSVRRSLLELGIVLCTGSLDTHIEQRM